MARKNLMFAIQDDEDSINPYALQTRIGELKNLRTQLIKISTSSDSPDGKYDAEFQKIGDEINAIKQMLESAKSAEEQRKKRDAMLDAEMDDMLQSMNAENFRVKEYDDSLVRKLIECVKVKSDSEITVIFKGGVAVNIDLLK